MLGFAEVIACDKKEKNKKKKRKLGQNPFFSCHQKVIIMKIDSHFTKYIIDNTKEDEQLRFHDDQCL